GEARIKRNEEVPVAERKIARHYLNLGLRPRHAAGARTRSSRQSRSSLGPDNLVRGGAPGRVEVALRVCDHTAEVAALHEVGANERATDAEAHDPGAKVVRNLVEVDVAGG